MTHAEVLAALHEIRDRLNVITDEVVRLEALEIPDYPPESIEDVT